MIKEILDRLKALTELLGNPKAAAAIFLCSAAWVFPPTRELLPVRGSIAEYAGLIASICMTLSGAHLVVGAVIWSHRRLNKWLHSPERVVEKALRNAIPLEKLVLAVPIRMGEHRLWIDVGSPLAMHLQKIGLIKRAMGLPHTEYWLAAGLAEVCVRRPDLLRLSRSRGRGEPVA